MKGSKEINLAFQGGGAKGFMYIGCLQALQKQSFKLKNVAGSSAGAISALLMALGVKSEDVEAFLIKKKDQSDKKNSSFGNIDDIQDYIPTKDRQGVFDSHFNLMEQFIFDKVDSATGWLKSWIFKSMLWPQIEAVLGSLGGSLSQALFEKRGKLQKQLVPQMLINGQVVYGQVLVQIIEKFLDKYLSPYLEDPDKRKNITLAEFKYLKKVNLIITGTDLTSKCLRIFSATTTPELPVKYAIRISAGFPFFFPPIYWLEDWGEYRDQDITGHKMIDGGVLMNLPTPLLCTSKFFREEYIGSGPVAPNSIIAFCLQNCGLSKEEQSFKTLKSEREIEKKEVASLPDIWPPFLDQEYLSAVRKGEDFQALKKNTDSQDIDEFKELMDEIPGLKLLEEIIETKICAQEIFAQEVFKDQTVVLNSAAVETLNIALQGVNSEYWIKEARTKTERFIKARFKKK